MADAVGGPSIGLLRSVPRSAVPQALALAGIILCVSTTSTALVTYTPVLFTDMGIATGQVGLMVAILALGVLVGGVTAGTLADRIGGRMVVILSMFLAVVPVYASFSTEGLARLALLATAGFFIGMPHSILVLAGQNLLPGRRGAASGIILGFTFFAGSVGALLIGVAADQVGLAQALQAIAILPLIAAVIALTYFERTSMAQV